MPAVKLSLWGLRVLLVQVSKMSHIRAFTISCARRVQRYHEDPIACDVEGEKVERRISERVKRRQGEKVQR